MPVIKAGVALFMRFPCRVICASCPEPVMYGSGEENLLRDWDVLLSAFVLSLLFKQLYKLVSK